MGLRLPQGLLSARHAGRLPGALGALGAAAAAFLVLMYTSTETNRFVPNACANVAAVLPANVIGQDLAVRQLIDAVCEHVYDPTAGTHQQRRRRQQQQQQQQHGRGSHQMQRRAKPLIISVHGPPGVGKTFTHTLLARALYNRDPAAAESCPGKGCVGAKVLYGMSYLEMERDTQLAAVRDSVLAHLGGTPDPLLVIEDYDKLDCWSRGLVRQLMNHPEHGNAFSSKPIVLLESNLGFLELVDLLTLVRGNKSAITPEDADWRLRKVLTTEWQRQPCESLQDTLSFITMVDFFLPYFPLTRPDITKLMEMELAYRYGDRLAAAGASLVVDPGAVTWLVNRIAFGNDEFPIEGAKQVDNVCIKHVSALVRRAEQELDRRAAQHHSHSHHRTSPQQALTHHQPSKQQHHQQHGADPGTGLAEYRLQVAPGGRELQLVAVEPGT